MKKIALAAGAALLSVSSMAADNWSGLYVGLNVANVKTENTILIPNYAEPAFGINPSKTSLGLNLGYNMAMGNGLILGVQLDYQKLGNNGSNPSYTIDWTPGDELYHVKANRQTALSARVGYDAGNWMPYFRLGRTNVKYSELNFIPTVGPEYVYSSSFSGTVRGIGVDYKLDKNWILGAEYSDADLGTKRLVYYGPVDVSPNIKAFTFRASYLFN